MVRGPVDALTVLTRIPVRRPASAPPADLAAAAPWFPVIGALVGVVAASVGVGSATIWPVGVAAALAVLVDVLLTGALHLDGLADCADGTGGQSRERRLAIMKDHSVGVYGAAAVVFDLLLRTLCLAGLLMLSPWAAFAAIVAAWTLSRAAMLPPALLLGYARSVGTGQTVIEGLTRRRCAAGLAAAFVVAGLVVLPLLGVVALLGALVGATLGALAPAVWASSRLGGATGDVLGAVAECALVGALLGLLAFA